MIGRQAIPHRVVAEMEEASMFTNEYGIWDQYNILNGGQASLNGRLAALEDLRYGNSPMELDFILQGPKRTHLRTSVRLTSPSVAAIAPPGASRLRHGAPPSSHKPPTSPRRPAVAAVRVVRSVSTVIIPSSIRGGGRRICGVLGAGALSAGSLVGHIAACSAQRATRLSGTALSGAVHAMRTAAKAAAAQPNRLRILVRRLPVRHLLTSPLRAIAVVGRLGRGNRGNGGGSGRSITREVRQSVKARRSKRGRGTAQSAGTNTAEPLPPPPAGVAAAPSSDATLSTTPSVLRARSLLSNATQSHDGVQKIPSTLVAALPSQPSYVLATASAVPALLLSQGTGSTAVDTSQGAGRRSAAAPSTAAAGVHGTHSRGRRRLGRRLQVAADVMRVPARTVVAAGMAAAVVAKYGSAALLCAFFPRSCHYMGLAALLSGPSLPLPPLPGLPRPLPNPLPPGPRRTVLAPMRPFRGPFAAFAILRLLGPLVAPALWRGVMYWQRAVPIIARYLWTGRRAAALRRSGRTAAAEQLWQRQHECGAGAMFDMLAELKGFYLKLGQILACKTDMLPPAYTASLSRLLDRLPPAPYRVVCRTIESELGAPPERLFRKLDPFPLASATVAQVHRALLPDGGPVVVKVQHAASRASMASDLANLRALSALVEAAGLNLGFDHGSLVREYAAQVPLEFDFAREAAVATSIRSSLSAAAASFPALRRVVIPAMHPQLSSSRVLTMEYLDGVPLLDIEGMDLAVRHGLMTSLILAYGIMILQDGLFHSDPHPGNLLAMRKRRSVSVPGAAAATHEGGGPLGAATGSVPAPVPGSAAAAAAGHTHPLHSPPSPAAPDPMSAPLEADELQIALLDFGQAKQLSRASRVRYAKLVAAMAVRDDDLVLAVAREVGLVVDCCSPGFAATATYILYDTRMDFPEAHMGPMDPEAHEFRTAKVPKLPQDLFMIMRVITLLRGLLSSLQVDISAAQLWRPLALQVLADLTSVGQVLPISALDAKGNAMGGSGSGDGGDGSLADNAVRISSDWSSIMRGAIGVKGSPGAQAPVVVDAEAGMAHRTSNSHDAGASPLIGSKKMTEGQLRREQARRKAEEAERKRREREEAKREEEARRLAEREAKAKRQREEKEAKAARQRALRQEAEARRRGEREEREARKRAEIEANNARRRAEREAAEAARAKKTNNTTSGRQQQGRGSMPQASSSLAEVAAAGSGDGSSPRSACSSGTIHSPTPVRLTPPSLYANLSPTSRLANASGLNSPASAVGTSCKTPGDEVQYYPGAAADVLVAQGIHPSSAQSALGAAAAIQQLPPNNGSGARFLPYMAPLSTTAHPGATTAYAGRKSYGDEAIAAAVRAAMQGDSEEVSKMPLSAASAPAAGGGIVRPPSPSPYGSVSLLGTAQSVTAPAGVRAGPATAGGNATGEGPMDELTARLIARANQFAAVVQQPPGGGGTGSSSTMSQNNPSQTQSSSGFAMAPGPGLRMMVPPGAPGSQRSPISGQNEQQQLLTNQQQQQQSGGRTVSPPRDPGSSQRLQPTHQLSQKQLQHQQQLQQLQQLQQQLQMLRATRTAPSATAVDAAVSRVSTSPSHSTHLAEPQRSSQSSKISAPAPVSVLQPPASQSGAQPPAVIPSVVGPVPLPSPQAPSLLSTVAATAVASLRASWERRSQATMPSHSPPSQQPQPQLQPPLPSQQQKQRRSQELGGTTSQATRPPASTAVGSGTSQTGSPAASTDIYAQARALLESTRRLVPPAQMASGQKPTVASAVTSPTSPPTGISSTSPVVIAPSATAGNSPSPDGGGDTLRTVHSTPHGNTTGPVPAMLPSVAARSMSVVAATDPGASAGPNTPRRSSIMGSVAIAEASAPISAPTTAANAGNTPVVQEIEPAGNVVQSPPPSQSSFTAAVVPVSGGVVGSGNHRNPATSEVSLASLVEGAVGRELSAAMLTPAASARRTPVGAAEGAAAGGPPAGGMHRTADGMLLQSEEDYSMWLARQQQSGVAGSETSTTIPHVGAPQQHHHHPHQPAQQLGQQPIQQQAPQAPQQQLPQHPLHAPNALWTVPGAPGAGAGGRAVTATEQAWAVGGAASSSGSTRADGASKTTPAPRRGGVEAVKKGLSRIGRKIVGGLA